MRAKINFEPKTGNDLMAAHIERIIMSHINIRGGWSRLVSIGDLIAILQIEYESISESLKNEGRKL